MSRSRGSQVRDVAIADMNRAAGRLLEPCDQAQQRALAAAGWTDQHQQLAIGDIERGTLDADMAVAVNLTYRLKLYCCHARLKLLYTAAIG